MSLLSLVRHFLPLLAALVGMLSVTPALSQEIGRDRTYGDLSQGERIAFIHQTLANGNVELAARLLSQSRFSEGDLGYQAAYLQAVVFRQQNRISEAEDLLRRILAERPDFLLVRQELASVMLAAGNRDGARHHLRLLADATREPDVRRQFEQFIDRIDEDSAFQIGGYLTIAPSTNLNNGSAHDTILVNGLPFRIGSNGRAKSGVGVSGGLNLSYTLDLTESLSAYAAGSIGINDYPERSFDTITGDLRLGLTHRSFDRLIGIEAIADRRWFSGDPSDFGRGARLYGRILLAPRFVYSGEVRFMRRSYDADSDADRNNWRAMGRLNFVRHPHEIYSLELGVERETVPRQGFNAFRGIYAEVGVQRELPFGINSGLFVKAGINRYDDDFPGSTAPREDRFLKLSANFLKRDWSFSGFTPRLGLSYYRQESNVNLYDHDRVSVDLTITKEF